MAKHKEEKHHSKHAMKDGKMAIKVEHGVKGKKKKHSAK